MFESGTFWTVHVNRFTSIGVSRYGSVNSNLTAPIYIRKKLQQRQGVATAKLSRRLIYCRETSEIVAKQQWKISQRNRNNFRRNNICDSEKVCRHNCYIKCYICHLSCCDWRKLHAINFKASRKSLN